MMAFRRRGHIARRTAVMRALIYIIGDCLRPKFLDALRPSDYVPLKAARAMGQGRYVAWKLSPASACRSPLHRYIGQDAVTGL